MPDQMARIPVEARPERINLDNTPYTITGNGTFSDMLVCMMIIFSPIKSRLNLYAIPAVICLLSSSIIKYTATHNHLRKNNKLSPQTSELLYLTK